MWISVWKLLTTSPLFIISLLNKNLFPTPIFRMISKEEKKTRGTNLASAYLRAVWRDWAIYWTLGNFSKPKATINLPKSSTFLGDFWGLKSLIFLVKSFWATFIDIWRFFSGHTARHHRHFSLGLLATLFSNISFFLYPCCLFYLTHQICKIQKKSYAGLVGLAKCKFVVQWVKSCIQVSLLSVTWKKSRHISGSSHLNWFCIPRKLSIFARQCFF